MSYRITIDQDFPQSPEVVFGTLSDHEALGRLLGQDIRRVKDAPGKNPNGVGSVRRIKVPLSAAFEETVTQLETNRLIEYKVTEGSPIKNHVGRLEFSEHNGGTRLHYTIDFEPKLALPLWGTILKTAIRGPIASGLKRFANSGR